MIPLARRGLLLAAAGAVLAPRPAPAAINTEVYKMYDYLFLDLVASAGAPPARAFAEQVRGSGVADAGGQLLGLFTPQLGWRARQAALLVAWPDAAPRRAETIARLAALTSVASAQPHRLTPTVRPTAGARPAPGGIYVHRWFVIETPALEEFVELSVTGWRDFETRFDTQIFGLFTAEPTAQDRAAGETRLLLCTRYGDHGVWEASRDPTTEAMAAFQRRQKLTRETWAASTLLTPL